MRDPEDRCDAVNVGLRCVLRPHSEGPHITPEHEGDPATELLSWLWLAPEPALFTPNTDRALTPEQFAALAADGEATRRAFDALPARDDRAVPAEAKMQARIDAGAELTRKRITKSKPIAAGYTGDTCATCNGMRLVRSGTCSTCMDCGSTTGCS